MVGVQYSTMYGGGREEDTKKKRGRDEEYVGLPSED